MEDIEKVRRLIRNLQEQEQGYRGLLQNTLVRAEHKGSEGIECRPAKFPIWLQFIPPAGRKFINI